MACFPIAQISKTVLAAFAGASLCVASTMGADSSTGVCFDKEAGVYTNCTPVPAGPPQRRRIEPGTSFSWNYGYELGCTDLLDAEDAQLTKETGLRMHRTNRPASSPAPDCEYLSPHVEFTIVKVLDDMKVNSLTWEKVENGSWGNPAFRRLCPRPTVQYALRPTTQEEFNACRWVIVFLP